MDESARLLITTAIEESWGCHLPSLFLGEWCRMYGRQSVWKNMDAKVVPFHWNDREKLSHDYEYLCELYERILPLLAKKLNEIHGVDYSSRYWRILIGPWLAYFMHSLFDRWESIQQAVNKYSIVETIVLTGDEEAIVPYCMEQFFSELVGSHEWNHSIYAFILENFTEIKCVKKVSSKRFERFWGKTSENRKSNLKTNLIDYYSKFAEQLVKNDDSFFIATYLSPFNELKLHLRFHQVPLRWTTVPPMISTVDLQKREWICSLPEQSLFETCLLSLIPKQIPIAYLEGYEKIVKQTKNLPWPKKPPLIFTSNVLWHATIPMAYSAYHVEKGAKLVYGQHGGYGLLKFQWSEKHEIDIADRFLTWGWTEEDTRKLIPVGILKQVNNYQGKKGVEKNRLLLVRASYLPYTFRLDSDVGLPQALATIDRCIKFAGLLSEDIRCKSLIVRLYPLLKKFSAAGQNDDRSSEDFFCEELRWRNSMPEVHLNKGLDRINILVAQSRLVIYSYNGGTGYLEFMAAGLPVLAFWDMKASPVRDSAIPYFEDLKRVGIFHETPESAAAHVNTIWNDVQGWWESTEVQEVVVRFMSRYCHKPDNLLEHVEAALRDVIVESKPKHDSE